MSSEPNTAIDTARDYYDSEDADGFYAVVWGGEDIHIGLYESEAEPIKAASRRTVEHMAKVPSKVDGETRVLDLGAGYGGAARYLAATHGCRVTALNLSTVENERNRTLNREQGLQDLVEVVDGPFEQLPFEDEAYDLIWSQDAILHSGDRPRVLREAHRVMRPGAEMVFTDPMRSDDCPEGVLQPILDRIHLEDLGSPGAYRKIAEDAGLEFLSFEDLTPNLVRHYTRVLEETDAHAEALEGKVSQGYLDRMKVGLGHWIEGGRKGHLAWGVFHLRKPE